MSRTTDLPRYLPRAFFPCRESRRGWLWWSDTRVHIPTLLGILIVTGEVKLRSAVPSAHIPPGSEEVFRARFTHLE